MTKKKPTAGVDKGKRAAGKAVDKPRELTAQQKLFVKEYLVDLNATAAAKRAKYSEKTAEQLGYQLLQIPSVQSEIQAALKIRFKRLDLMGERVLLELYRIAFADTGQAYDEEGRLLAVHEMPEDLRRAIAGFEAERTVVVSPYGGSEDEPPEDGEACITSKVKFADKVRALEMLAKHFRLISERVDHNHKGKITLADLVAGSWNEEEPNE